MALADDLRHLIEYDNEKVLRILRGLIGELPRSYETRLLLGDAYLRGLQFDLALEQYRIARSLAPNARAPAIKVALCQVYTGKYAAAIAELEVLVQRGRDEYALALVGLLLHRLGRPAEAITRFRTLIDSAPKVNNQILFGLQGLMLALRDQKQLPEADKVAARLLGHIQQHPDHAPAGLHSLNTSFDYFEWSRLADKGELAVLLTRHAAKLPDTRFFPDSFVLPEQRAAFMDYAAHQTAGAVYIVKHRHGQGGQSIHLTDQAAIAANAQDAVVQRYIDDPYLVDGKKAHMRIYGLVSANGELRIHVYKDGIVRFAPEPYQRGPGWLENVAMHITNTALHRGHPQLKIETDPSKENAGNIWSLNAYLSRIAADGHDAAAVFTEIARLVGHFVLMLRDDGMFNRQAEMGPGRSFLPKLFGLDVLLDSKARPWLIEIQRSPAWNGPPLVQRINNRLAMTLARMNIGPILVDTMSATQVAEIQSGASAITQRERAIEDQNRGAFVRLVHGATD